MRHLPQTNWCATLHALFPGRGAELAERFARLNADEATDVMTTRGTSLNRSFAALSRGQVDAALDALHRYRKYALSASS